MIAALARSAKTSSETSPVTPRSWLPAMHRVAPLTLSKVVARQ